MISKKDRLFNLSTKKTTYLFAITETGHLEHLYYGRYLSKDTISIDALAEKRSISIGTGTAYDSDHPTLFFNNLCMEYSTMGKGDYRESSIDISYSRGMQTLDFIVKSYRILPGKPRIFSGMPESYGDKTTCTTLEVMLKEACLPLRLALTYTVFEDSNVITRRATLYNDSNEEVTIKNLASAQLDLDTDDWKLVTFDGAWSRERYMHERPLAPGIMVNDSKSGLSSAEHNPCIFLTKDNGETIGMTQKGNLLFS